MSDQEIDLSRRRFFTTAATVVGGVGIVAGTVPFISSMSPSEKTKAFGAPVEVDISNLMPGDLKVVKWQGKPIWILRRSEGVLKEIKEMSDLVNDPESEASQQPSYAKNIDRSIKPGVLVVIGICTHLGCSPLYVKQDEAATHNLGDGWNGGFLCPCHNSKFDLAGRVYKNVPAPTNLVVPPYRFLSTTRILIGDESEVG